MFHVKTCQSYIFTDLYNYGFEYYREKIDSENTAHLHGTTLRTYMVQNGLSAPVAEADRLSLFKSRLKEHKYGQMFDKYFLT